MTYDPFQIQSVGAYPGFAPSFQSPYTQINPLATLNPLTAAYPPVAGISPQQLQQLQLAQILAARAAVPQQLLAVSPWTNGLNNPLQASPVLQNPLIAAILESPLVNQILAQMQFGAQPYPFSPYVGQSVPQFGQIGAPYGQIGVPYGQIPAPYGQISSMLPPQSWVGQPGLYGSHGHGLVQVHPLVSQLVGRGYPGMFPASL
jgi:hypothetical protein